MKNIQRKQIFCIGLILILLITFISIHFTFIITKTTSLEDSPIYCFQGPEITNVVYTPEKPELYDNVTITAQVTDPWGILEVWINYNADNDVYAGWGANFTMIHVSDDLYSYNILNSIWDSPNGPAHGSYVNFTIHAKNGLGDWSQSGYYQFYMNDTVKPIAEILTLDNNSYVSGLIQINTTIIEAGSGLKQANLSIYMGNGTLLERFTSTNLNETFLWDVSSLPDYNIAEPSSYFTINFTAWDNANPTNKDTIILESIRVDNTAPYMAFINSYKNLTTFVQDNQTLTSNIISASNFMNNFTNTFYNNSNYHSFYNGSSGFLQVAYGLNLSQWNLTTDMLNTLSITLEGKIGYSDSSILQAGWKIWNWVAENFTIIDSTIFNNTDEVSDILYLSTSNKSLYINSSLSHRIEIFFFINTTGPAINASIDYILYNITHYKADEWYNRENEKITLKVMGFDLISFDRIELHHENYTYYTWNSSGIYFLKFNTTVLPDGLVPLNITVYDKAGNSNSSSILLNVDYFGPIITIISLENNSYIGESQIWNLIVPIELSGYDIAKNFQRMELWIDGAIAPVLSGQLGQIFEYDEFGNITYMQTNATWYEEGNYTYYWNASTLIHNSTHELRVLSYDGFDNPNVYKIFVTMVTFNTNISIVDVRENYSIISDAAVILEFTIINYGNSTLKDFTPQIITNNSNWDWWFKDVDSFDFKYLSPGESLTFKIEIIPRSVQNTINQTIELIINCQIVENLTQTTNNFTIQFQTYLVVQPQTGWQGNMGYLQLFLSILAGLGIGIFAFYIIQYLKKASTQPPKPPEKMRKGK
ncbi:MAG: hypothetical protein HWN66_03585 [Candidatus Helarchaeota archaeon]|nr:hypothetical protein [Candidatus Helarchaeota archaeon]